MTSIPTLVKSLSEFLQNHQVSFANGLLVLFTVCGEQIFRVTVFRCPCSQPNAAIYASSFVIGPMIILILLGILINNLTWRLYHGFCNRIEKSKHTKRETFGYCCIIFCRSCIVSCAWLFITFLDGSYFVCMLSKKPCDQDSNENIEIKALSQIISWSLLSGIILVAFITICTVRCRDNITYLQNKNLLITREAEEKQFNIKMQEFANKKAECQVNSFLAQSQLQKEDWDLISKAHGIMNKELQPSACTPLQMWIVGKDIELVSPSTSI